MAEPGTISVSAPAKQAAEPVMEISDDVTAVALNSDANLYSSASENGGVIETLNAGTWVTVVGESDRWYLVDYNGISGYIHKNLLGWVAALNSDANFYSAASDASDVLGILNAGTQVTVIGKSDRWYLVNCNGSTGYINRKLVG